MSRQWTTPQQNAIDGRGGTLLVSAAAGSGKTAVLVERVVTRILDEREPVDADRLLIVTFTNAAAAEMKQRIRERLGEIIRTRPDDIRLQKQQALLARASIGTVHSFCLELVREQFQHLPISPEFALADEGELTVLRDECAHEVIERFYAQDEHGVFASLVELLSAGRDDSRLVQTMLRVHEFARAHPFPDIWLERMRALYRADTPVAETIWGKALLDHAAESLEYCVDALQTAFELCEAEEAVRKAYGPAIASDLTQAGRCLELVRAGAWDEAVAALRDVTFDRLGALRGNESAKQRVKSVRDRCKKMIQTLRERALSASGADFAQDMTDLRPKVESLFDLVLAFGELFAQRKLDKKRMDFSDLEHFAIRLLVRPEGEGYRRTDIAQELSERFDHVLVDEFQDTNEVQDLIFSSVSRDEQNLFFVGDAKQSIYSFRLAMPEIFLDKKRRFAEYDAKTYPARVSLDTNFRSRGEVTGAVNYLFGMLMSARMGDIAYEGDERLTCGAQYPDYPGAAPELVLLDTHEYAGKLDPAELEARAVAAKISELLHNGYQVCENGAMRPARPGDFCILMRSPKNRSDLYVKALGECGITAWAQNAGGFLQAREVSMVVSLLEALDNPLLDISLAAALLSPLYGFTDEDIARVRLGVRGGPLYLALTAAAKAGDEQCAAFLEEFDALRRQAAVLPADRLLLEVYERTDALAVAQAMPLGAGRRANLLQLVEYAAHYHALGYKHLGGLLGFLSNLRERGGDLAPAGTTGEGAGAVRVMSVHRSKGLEFPIVILADTSKQFNRTDLYQNTQLHARFGFACARRDAQTMKQFATVPMQAIRLESERSMLSEELRVLYVALTRAKEKLIVFTTQKTNPSKKLAGLAGDTQNGKLSPRVVGDAHAPADWLLMALLHHPDAGALRELAGGVELPCAEDRVRWTVHIVRPDSAEDETQAVHTLPRTAEPDPAVTALLHARAAWRYTHEALTHTPTKLAISEVAKGEAAKLHRFTRRPKFLSDRAMTGAERGNALHKFMQFADYGRAKEDAADEAERLRAGRWLSDMEADSLDIDKIDDFFHGSLANRIFASTKVWRELKFMWECGQDMLDDFVPDLPPDGKIALQGVADCVFVENDGIVIVDYKTDYVTSGAQLLERYSGQLTLYARILARTLELPVRACLLYSFALSREVEVPFVDRSSFTNR